MSQEIHNLIDSVYETWNAGDAAAYAALFTEDADYITYFGLRLKGRQAIDEGHRDLFKMPIKIEAADEPSVRMLSDTVALVIATGASVVNGEREPGRDSVLTYTAVHTPDGWRFASFQNTRVGRP
jgi:uncharacterized protein (TIGR02246 family)